MNTAAELFGTGKPSMADDSDEIAIENSRSKGFEMNVTDLLSKLWRRRILGIVFVVLSVLAGSLYLRLATYTFTTELVLTPAEQNAARISSNLAGLGSLVGLNLGSGESSGFAMYEEAIKSYAVAVRLSEDPVIMHRVFEGLWDQQDQVWREPRSVSVTLVRTVKYLLGVPTQRWRPPGPKDLQEYIRRAVVIRDDKIKPITTVSFDHKDPEFSVYFLDRINAEADNFLRQKSLVRSTEYIKYLQHRLNEVQIVDYRQGLLDQLRFYERMRMMADSDVSFVAEVFGGAQSSQRPTRPRPSIVLVVCFALGVVSWILHVLFWGQAKDAVLKIRRDSK